MKRKLVLAAPHDDLAAFLLELRADCLPVGDVAVEAHQLDGDVLGPLVRAFVYNADSDSEKVAERVVAACQTDCDGLGKAQRYSISIVAQNKSRGRFVLPVKPRTAPTCPTCGGLL